MRLGRSSDAKTAQKTPKKCVTDRLTNGPTHGPTNEPPEQLTDTVGYRVTCTQLKSKNKEVSPPNYGKYDLAMMYQQSITINDSKSHHGSSLYLNFLRELIKKAIGDRSDHRFLWFISHIVLYFCTQLLSFYVIDLQDLSCIIPCFYSLSHREISWGGDTPRSYMDHATDKRNQYQFPCWNLALDSLSCMLWKINYLPWFSPAII